VRTEKTPFIARVWMVQGSESLQALARQASPWACQRLPRAHQRLGPEDPGMSVLSVYRDHACVVRFERTSMPDADQRRVLQGLREPAIERRFVVLIQRGRGLVEEQPVGLEEEGAGDG